MKIPEDKEFDELVERFRKIAKDENEMIQLLGEEVLKRFLQFASPNSNKKEKLSIEEPSSSTLGNKQKFSETENEEHQDHDQQTNTTAVTPEAISKKARLLEEKSLKKPSVSGKKRPSLTQHSWCQPSIDQIFSAQNSNNKKLTINEPSDTCRKFSEIEKEKHHDNQETYIASTFKPSKKTRLLKEKSLKKPVSVSREQRPKSIQPLSWYPQPELPMEIRNVIERLGGSDAKLVIEKEVYKTDLHSHHDRISIPKNKVRVEFLNEQEKNEIENNDGIRVRVIEPCLRETILSLRQWQLRSSVSYVLNSGWKYVAARAENQLRVEDKVQVWSFRVNGELRLAVVKLPRGNLEEAQNSNDSQTTEDEVKDEDEDEDEDDDEAALSTSPTKEGKATESQKV